MPIERSTRRIGSRRLAAIARELLDASTLCAIATVDRRNRAYANTAYFGWREWELVWLSEPRATHSANVRANGSAAVAVYDSHQVWGSPDRGIQLFGTAREVAGRASGDAASVYATRFTSFDSAGFAAYRFYALRPRRLKLFDERELGAGVFVTARVTNHALEWERTDVYRSTD